MLRATLKGLLSRKLRLLLSGLAVVLGVMFVSGSVVLTDTISRSFEQMIATAYDEVDVVVQGQPSTSAMAMAETEPMPARVVDQVEVLPEVDSVVAEIFAPGARAIDASGQVVSTFSVQLGSNWVEWPGDSELVQLREGRGPTAADEVAINAELARAGGFAVGDEIGVLTREPRREFTVVGIFGYAGERDSLFGETHVAFTTAVAQELMLGQGDVFTELSVMATGGVDVAELRDAVAAAVGDEYVVRTGEQVVEEESAQLREELSFLTYILLGFAGVALFVGVFLVLNTFSIIVAQRQRELALMRAIGASRRQVLGVVMAEAAVIGLLASVVGLLLGIGVGAGLAALVGSFLDATLAGVGVPAGAVIGAFAVGLLVTVVAALIPAMRASRVPPVAAMREAATPDRPLTRLSVAGAVVTVAGVAALALGLAGDVGDATLPVVLAGVLLAFIGVALLTPLVARPVVSALGRVFAWSTPGELGRRNTARNPRRTAITAAALMVGVALVTAVSTIFSSLSASVERIVDGELQADLVVGGQWAALTPPTFDRQVLAETRALPDVVGVAGFWLDSVDIDGDDVIAMAVDDLPAWRDMAGGTVVDGSLAQLGTGQLAVDDRLAEQRQLGVGDTVTVTLPRGERTEYEVVSVYERTDLLQGPLLSADDADGFRTPHPSQAFVHLRDGADVAAVRAELAALLADSPEVRVQDRSGFIEQQTQAFDQVVVFIQLLLVLAMVIAVLGVVNTLVLSVIERTRELGLLRAIGLGRGATARMVTVESVVISLFGALLGIVTGALLGSAVVYALREEGFRELALPWGLMVTYLLIAALVGVAAAVIPAVRAARLNVLAAIAYE
jgi:putative ABC transport system permease protein